MTLLTLDQAAEMVALNAGLAVSESGLICRAVAVTQCALCEETHPVDHRCEPVYEALLREASKVNARSARTLNRISRQTQKAPADDRSR